MSTSLTEQQMLDVMAYADGELEGEDLERVKALVASDPAAKELLASLNAIGDGVRSSFDVGRIDVRDAVMANLPPNDLDKARLRRIARRRIAIVGASIVALAAAVLLYVRDSGTNGPTGQNSATPPVQSTMLASADGTGVQVDFVDTPSAVSVFYVPAEVAGGDEHPTGTDTAPSVVIWVNDTPLAAEATP
jgi:anti-sigma factor RsiW